MTLLSQRFASLNETDYADLITVPGVVVLVQVQSWIVGCILADRFCPKFLIVQEPI